MTEVLLTALLVNTLAAALLGGLALLAWRRYRKPLIAHALVVVALIKLVTPPLWGPVAFEATAENTSPVLRSIDLAALRELQLRPTEAAAAPSWWQSLAWPDVDPWIAALAVWLAGSAIAIAIMLRRHRRFTAVLERLDPAPRFVETLAAPLAHDLGLKTTPLLRVADSAMQPFLFALGAAPTIVLPRAAVDELDSKGLRALLAHELAHLRNRDHWTRALELVVAATHWWNPVAHLLRSLLREVEEVRCDARAVATLNASPDRLGPKRYGRALLDATDLLETRARELGSIGFAAPLGATALSDAGALRRRITALATGSLPCRLGSMSRSSLLLAAGSMLPLGLVAAPAGAALDDEQDVAVWTFDPDGTGFGLEDRDGPDRSHFGALARVEVDEESSDGQVQWRLRGHLDRGEDTDDDVDVRRLFGGLAKLRISSGPASGESETRVIRLGGNGNAFVVDAPETGQLILDGSDFAEHLAELAELDEFENLEIAELDLDSLADLHELRHLEGLGALRGLGAIGIEVDVDVDLSEVEEQVAKTLQIVRVEGHRLAEILGEEVREELGDVEIRIGDAAGFSGGQRVLERLMPGRILRVQADRVEVEDDVRSY